VRIAKKNSIPPTTPRMIVNITMVRLDSYINSSHKVDKI
jgi:hypothetical protein